MPLKEIKNNFACPVFEKVLILHNTFGPANDPLYESRAGVLEQVKMVEQSCDKLGIKSTTLTIENLNHLMKVLESRKEKIIFNLIEEFVGNIEHAPFVPVICQAFGKACTGSKTSVLVTAQNKFQTKALLSAHGISCPTGIVLQPAEKFNPNLLKKGKYIIKPALSDASEGITADCVVSMPTEREKAKAIIRQLQQRFNQPIMIEQYIAGRELNVSVLQRNGKVDVLPIAEIDFSAFPKELPRIVDYSAKWEKESFAYNNTPRKIPADLDFNLSNEIEKLAISAWHALGCQDYIRVDFRLDEENKPYVIEINPNPDISADAGFAAALEAGGINYELFVFAIIENASKRLVGANPCVRPCGQTHRSAPI
ncbi:MAG: ATP-grasp domain-containing protein [Phycisphaerales bacterium]